MKTKIAAALSMVGVLGAGSAAALVNTQILDSGPSESGASAAVLPPAASVDVTVPSAAVDTLPVETTIVTLPDTTSPSTTVVASSTSAPGTVPAPSGFLTAFNVGEAGVVTVDVVNGRIVLVSAEPKAGWSVVKSEEYADDNEVEVYFASATVRVEFAARFVEGRIVPEVESTSLSTGGTATSGTVPSGSTGNTVPSGHDDDDHDDDEYDDEYEDDDHDDDDRDEDDDHDDDDHDDDDHDDRDDD